MSDKLIEPWGIYASFAFFVGSWILFGLESSEYIQSFVAAVLAAGLFWLSWVFVRLVILTIKR